MSRTVQRALASSSSPRMATKRAPSLSARFICDLRPRPSWSISTRTPGLAQRRAAGGGRGRARPAPGAPGTPRSARSGGRGRDQHDQPLHAQREADAGEVRAAEVLHEAVVAAAAEHAVLRAQLAAQHLERGAHVVVEPAHQAVAQAVGDAQQVQLAPHLGEVVAALRAEVVGDPRQGLDDRLVLGHLAVEHAQRVRLRAALAVGAELAGSAAQRRAQRLHVGGPAVRVAHRVQDQLVAASRPQASR